MATTTLPVFEVTVTSGGRVECVTVGAATAGAARRRALRACPWVDGRRHFVRSGVRRLEEVTTRGPNWSGSRPKNAARVENADAGDIDARCVCLLAEAVGVGAGR
jgi:hypothetical protein